MLSNERLLRADLLLKRYSRSEQPNEFPLMLRQQINVLRRTAPKALHSGIDRSISVGVYRLSPDARDALAIIKPDTVVRWHRAGFRPYWRLVRRIASPENITRRAAVRRRLIDQR